MNNPIDLPQDIKTDEHRSTSVEFTEKERTYSLVGTTEDEYILSEIRREATFYESDLLSLICHLSIPDGIFLDVGANIGNHSLFFAGEMDRDVYAFEMDNKNFRLLEDNIQRNGLSQKVRAFNVAVSDIEGSVGFSRNPRNCGASQIETNPEIFAGESFAVALDNFIQDSRFSDFQANSVALVKIDVEGHELHVLRSAIGLISKFKPIIVVEIHKPQDFNSIFKMLNKFDYYPLMVGAKSDTYIFCEHSAVNQNLNLAKIYYTRKHEKLANRFSKDALAFSNEFDRIKGLLSSLYDTNRNIRKELKEHNNYNRTSLLQSAWESEASRLCQLIQDNRKRKFFGKTLPPQHIKQIRQRITDSVESEIKGLAVNSAKLRDFRTLTPSLRHAAILVSNQEDKQVRNTVDDLRASGYDNISIFTKIENSKIEIRSTQTIEVTDFLEALQQITNRFPFQPILILDLASGIDVRKTIRWLLTHTDKSSTDDIIVFDGLRSPQKESSEINIASMSVLSEKISVSHQVSVPLSLNCVLKKPFWMPKGRKTSKSINLEFAVAALRDNMGIIAPTRPPLTESDTPNLELLLNEIKETKLSLPPVVKAPQKRLAIVGRLHEERWSRGGIYHSCVAYADICARLDIQVSLIEIDQSPSQILEQCRDDRVVLVYTGDQGAQDFFNVEPILKALDDAGHNVVANLSYDTYPERTKEIIATLETMSDRVQLMAFTEDVLADPALASMKERGVIIPKTIREVPRRQLEFSETSGIFMGDLGKFINPRITARAQETYEAIRECLPDAPIIFLEQYRTSNSIPEWLNNYELVSYSSSIIEHFEKARIYLHTQNYCTFEMLPVEAVIAGLPVVHCDMPQSLNTYIGSNGMRYTSLTRMQNLLIDLYNDQEMWAMASNTGADCARANSQDKQDRQFYFGVKALM